MFKIYDRASIDLTGELFTQILAGELYDDAIHHAKRTLIARGVVPRWWAGFVMIGGVRCLFTGNFFYR